MVAMSSGMVDVRATEVTADHAETEAATETEPETETYSDVTENGHLHHDDIPQHYEYEEGTFHYDTMAFGEICHNNDELIDTLIEYMKNNCVMKEEYRARADDFFEFSDHNNCKRIYDIMLDYQRNIIG